MSEFSLIEKYCQAIGESRADTILGVGDDAAVLQLPNDKQLVVSVDTMVAGVHFFEDVAPAKLAHKILAVNLSDIAAMGATPAWATLALTLPEVSDNWLAEFSQALDKTAKQYQLQLVGGDTTQGALSLSLTIMGQVDSGKALSRSGAEVGDKVFVSNTVGDAAVGLAILQGKLDAKVDEQQKQHFIDALELPEPQLQLGNQLVDVASACIDVSDGLLADLSHIAKQSKVSMVLDPANVPRSKPMQQMADWQTTLDYCLTGGDDYQLAFTVPEQKLSELDQTIKNNGLSITQIGSVVTPREEAIVLEHQGESFEFNGKAGYQHFS